MQLYTKLNPTNILAQYIPRLIEVNGHGTTSGLSPQFEKDVAAAVADVKWRQAQDQLNDRDYFNPSQDYAKQIGAR